jgi:glycosyltransferase involved in cell wall biosynthesis
MSSDRAVSTGPLRPERARPGGSAPADHSTVGRTHVCLVLPFPERYSSTSGGAVATVSRQLTRSLLERGHAVTVITPDDGGAMYDDGEVVRLPFGPAFEKPDPVHKALVLEARLRHWTWPEYGSYVRSVFRSLSGLARRPDVVIVANDVELAYRLHRKGIGRRQVLWLHNDLQGKEARRLASLSPDIAIVAVSDSVRRWTSEQFGIRPEAIHTIHNGIDGVEFHPRAAFTEPATPLKVVCHGRIDPNKGQDVAAAAVADLRRQGHPVTFTLIGGVQTFGLTEEETRSYADRLDRLVTEADGRALGRIPASEVAPILREHDVVCVLSRTTEPFPLAALEAMASGCAVVTTGNGGIAEMVGESAVLVGSDDAPQVAAALRNFVEHPEALAERKVAALRRSEQFSWANAAVLVEGLTAEQGSRV